MFVLGPLLPAYAAVLPALFWLLDTGLRRAGVAGGADPRWFLGAVGAGTLAVVLNARRDRLVLDADGLRLAEGEVPVDLVAPWSAVVAVRRRRRGPFRLDDLVVVGGRVVRRDDPRRSALRGPLRERAFRRERERRRGAEQTVGLTRYGRRGWDGPLGEEVRRHRPDLAEAPPG